MVTWDRNPSKKGSSQEPGQSVTRDRDPRADSKQRKTGERIQTSKAGDMGHL